MAKRMDRKRASFEREASPHLNSLYRFAFRFVKDQSQAEDLVQEALAATPTARVPTEGSARLRL